MLSLAERAQVPFGRIRDVLLVKESEGIDRTLLDCKLYARGIGPVLGIEVSGGSDHEELVSFRPGRR